MKDCCRMLGIAITKIRRRSGRENMVIFPSVFSRDRRFSRRVMDKTQLTPWQIKVAHATPATSMEKHLTKRMSIRMLAQDEITRKIKGVLESPSAEKIPVEIL